MVVVNHGELEAGGDHHDATQQWHEDVAEGVESEPRPSLQGRPLEGPLRPLVLPVEVEPPECRCQPESKDRGQDTAGRQVSAEPDANGDHRLAEGDQEDQPMPFHEMRAADPKR